MKRQRDLLLGSMRHRHRRVQPQRSRTTIGRARGLCEFDRRRNPRNVQPKRAPHEHRRRHRATARAREDLDARTARSDQDADSRPAPATMNSSCSCTKPGASGWIRSRSMINAVFRYDSEQKGQVMAMQTSIDGHARHRHAVTGELCRARGAAVVRRHPATWTDALGQDHGAGRRARRRLRQGQRPSRSGGWPATTASSSTPEGRRSR